MTDRVKRALANANDAAAVDGHCGICGTELIRPESITAGRCAECQLTTGGADDPERRVLASVKSNLGPRLEGGGVVTRPCQVAVAEVAGDERLIGGPL
jgi:hypothetical protein